MRGIRDARLQAGQSEIWLYRMERAEKGKTGAEREEKPAEEVEKVKNPELYRLKFDKKHFFDGPPLREMQKTLHEMRETIRKAAYAMTDAIYALFGNRKRLMIPDRAPRRAFRNRWKRKGDRTWRKRRVENADFTGRTRKGGWSATSTRRK